MPLFTTELRSPRGWAEITNSTRAYFAGLAFGLVALSVMGQFTTRVNQFSNFTRFHRYLNPETLFYPTASQVVAVARDAGQVDDTLVIVGGSSVMFGTGQAESDVWTDWLRGELGEGFAVVNLALPAGAPSEHGAVAAQALLKEERDLVFITQVFPGTNGPDGIPYPYVVWDAEARGMLMPLASRDALWDEKRLELRLRARLDSVLYFTDLWTSLGYHCCMAIWNPLLLGKQYFFAPRAQFPDPEISVDGVLRYHPAREEAATNLVAREQSAWCSSPEARTLTIDSFIPLVSENLPSELLSRSIILIMHRSPYFTSRLDVTNQICRVETLRVVAERFRQLGYRAEVVGEDWTADDFVDLVHPSSAGGIKMARQLAPVIREMASKRSTPL